MKEYKERVVLTDLDKDRTDVHLEIDTDSSEGNTDTKGAIMYTSISWYSDTRGSGSRWSGGRGVRHIGSRWGSGSRGAWRDGRHWGAGSRGARHSGSHWGIGSSRGGCVSGEITNGYDLSARSWERSGKGGGESYESCEESESAHVGGVEGVDFVEMSVVL